MVWLNSAPVLLLAQANEHDVRRPIQLGIAERTDCHWQLGQYEEGSVGLERRCHIALDDHLLAAELQSLGGELSTCTIEVAHAE